MKVHELAPWAEELERLRKVPLAVLLSRYQELFGEPPRAHNRVFLLRRVAWRLQANLYGDLSERARQRARELADDRELRLTAPISRRAPTAKPDLPTRDARLPLPGAVLERCYRGRVIQVKVLLDGFEHEGQRFASLSAIAERVTGTRWNGFLFFGLQARKRAA
jgi:Protein of unknown function (DUF2924)